ncbi:hypothetical protein GCM10027413_27780 [Conyzicola nivalis]|uniref:Uncharacterized protein n=1 Tax=Conyzicola nivalis TaxID=1477021 RepID=A0A916SSW8_9MICO|nr:hypothetical protein GCM10010979_31730 [Conyzicola nivalis]
MDDGVELESVDGGEQRLTVDDVCLELGRAEQRDPRGAAGDTGDHVAGTHQERHKETPYFSGRTGK